ncbi:DEAD/DEAH box helicase [Chitinophaga sp. MM2321]|uniref:DEAD/DEAH box helicase n=1 Tax=Chitinophaga sp. MM2321 TaxID=3137178 RepID=UPI0032D5A201
MPINLLSEPIRRYIRDKRWEELRPIQAAAIKKIISTDQNFILASRTASGKTEAAFLPILSKLNFREHGVQVLYISPLIALINDQFYRVEELCKHLDISVTKWHGEASKAAKEAVVKQPNGIVLITPESIEAMFVNKPFNILHLFSNLRYVVIDEIHSFIGTERGIQLKSLLARIQSTIPVPFSIIGLSATIGDYREAKRFTGNEANTIVLLDRTKKEINAKFKYFEAEGEELPLALLKDLYVETKDDKVLIFPNNRGRAEEIAVKLRKISDKVGGHSNYFSHHSSVDKEVREHVEYFAKNNERRSFCIACTSTLELGIDIGGVDEVVQIDAANSIASLIQRVGRSGRKNGMPSNLFLYATNQWSLLQSIACWELYQEEFIEPPEITEKPYDILVHQILSILKGGNGITHERLLRELSTNFAFSQIDTIEKEEVISHLLSIDFIEKTGLELIIGVEGEKIVNNKDFYSVFISEPNFKVLHAGNRIGEIPFSPQIKEDENILLAAKIWKIKFVDFKAKKIEVVRAADGRKPVFFSGHLTVHTKIREKMLEIIYSTKQFSYLDEACQQQILEIRQEFMSCKIRNVEGERPLLVTDKKVKFYSFTGTKTNQSLGLLFTVNGIINNLDVYVSSFEMSISVEELQKKWLNLLLSLNNIDEHIESLLKQNPSLIDFSKWAIYLPLKLQIGLLKQQYYDFNAAAQLVNFIKLVPNSE